MPDSFTEVTERGLGSRLVGAIKGVLVGLVLFVLAFPLLFWNEGRAVKRHRDLQEGAGAVVSVSPLEVDAAHEGRLVHVAGLADTDAVLEDPVFGVSVNAIHLRRVTEMYQWVEDEEKRKEKQLGGSEKTVTTYTYEREWSDDFHDSSGFRHPEGHRNPPEIRHPSTTQTASEVHLGGFRLSRELVRQMEGDTPITPPAAPAGAHWRVEGSRVYVPAVAGAPAGVEPQVGDLRIRFEAVEPAEVSIVALQRGPGVAAWTGSEGSTIEDLELGVVSAEQMFAALENENRLIAWLLRLAGFVMMAIGLGMIFAPIAVAADVVPFLGDMLRFGAAVCAMVVSAALSLVTIAVGWVAYRPLVGVPLLVLGIAALAALLWAGRSRRSTAPAPEGAVAAGV